MLPSDEWHHIPPQSTFTLRVSGDTGAFESAALIENDQEVTWSHAQLVAGQSLTLLSSHIYIVKLRILFVGADVSPAVIDATVADPQGNTWGTPYHASTTGTNGDSDSATFGLTTDA